MSWFPKRFVPFAAALGLALLVPGRGQAQQDAPAPITPAERDALEMIHRRALHITSAELSVGARHCDVTRIIRQQCETRARCEVEVQPGLCTTEVLRGLIHVLTVHYTCHTGGLETRASEEEPRLLRLSCGRNPVQ